MLNLILFGPPGSGKGTQAAALIVKYDLLHISTGDLFRFNLKNNTPLGVEARSYIDKGDLVPDAVTVKMLKAKVDENPNVAGYIFDGFPRTITQAEALDALLAEKGESVTKLLMLDVPDEELQRRLLLRGKTSGRSDDTDPEIIKNRLNEYRNKTIPVFDFYAQSGKAIKVWGMGKMSTIHGRLSFELDNV
ncbi:MAG: adenylate kinase [Bacteroidota bacterium]